MPWKSLAVGVILLAAIGVTLGFFWPFQRRAENLRLTGVVEIQEVRLGSKLGGRVEKVSVHEGDIVRAGDVLVRFETPELEAQREQWQARLRSHEAEYEKARNGPRPEEIRQTQGELESAEADLVLSRQEYARIERLYRQGGSDRAEYDTARATRERVQGRVATARARLDMLKAGSRSEDIAEAEARVVEMHAKLRELDANLAEATVRAPDHALVEVVAVRKGDLVAPNQPIVRILRADDLWVRVYIPETELGKVRVGQSVQVTIDSYPGRVFAGTVFQVNGESEFTPRNIQSSDERRYQVFGAKIRVADSDGILKAGMAADVTFPLEE